MISKQEYQAQAAQGYNRIPLVQELLADLDTPLSLYLKLANRPYTYLLESVVGGERFAAIPLSACLAATISKPAANTSMFIKTAKSSNNTTAIRYPLSKLSTTVSKHPKSQACRALPAAWSATSVTKPSTISNTSPTA